MSGMREDSSFTIWYGDRKRPMQNTSATERKKNRAASKAASKARQKQRRSK